MIGSLAGLLDYAAARGRPILVSDAEATSALVRASDHITHAYVTRFAPGYDAGVPAAEAATYEAALLEAETPGLFAKVYTPGERKVLTEVKGIRWQVIGGGSDAGAAPMSTRIEAMLAPYMVLPVGIMVA